MPLMFCDRTSGNPSIKPAVAAAPAVSAAVLRKRRRPVEVCVLARCPAVFALPFFNMVFSSVYDGSNKSSRDHFLLDSHAGGERPLVLERDGGRVLQCNAGGVEQGDVLVRVPPLLFADDHFADFPCDVRFL